MNGKKLILITCVIVLSFAGIGYSSWIEGLSIESLFNTGNMHVIFKDPVIINNGLNEINANADEDVLDISGAVAPGSAVLVKYDIYNDSSIPVKYLPDEEALPEGITLDLKDTVIKPGESLRGQMTIEPGENELILPFVQYNSSVQGGWKEELRICWNISIVEETVDPELDMLNENATTEEAPIEDVTQEEEPIEAVPETESPVTEAKPEADTSPETDPIDSNTENDSAAENPAEETPAENPAVEAPSENPTINENVVENNAESDEGTKENVTNGEK